jgi:hypothetical protein
MTDGNCFECDYIGLCEEEHLSAPVGVSCEIPLYNGNDRGRLWDAIRLQSSGISLTKSSRKSATSAEVLPKSAISKAEEKSVSPVFTEHRAERSAEGSTRSYAERKSNLLVGCIPDRYYYHHDDPEKNPEILHP